jgi:hypothetical protein
MAFRMPFMSAPYGGTPPEDTGVIVNGGKPSGYEAAPSVIPICEVVGIVFFVPEFAKGMRILGGWLD